MKAFLCHSSKDKEYLSVIARRLGRSKIVFDEMSFEPGVDFRESISRNLDVSNLFVFFVSRDSLASTWCMYEVNEAQYRIIHNQVETALCIIIDRDVSLDQLPAWLRRSKVLIQPSPVQSAREVQNALISSLAPEQKRPFVGRENWLERFAQDLIAISQEQSSLIFSISGLEGIGRRTVLSRAVQDNLALRLGPSFTVDTARTIDDVYLWTLDETSDLGTRANMQAEAEAFGRLNHSLAMIHRRSPSLIDLPMQLPILSLSVFPLEVDSLRLLTAQLLRPLGIKPERKQLDELVGFLDGYPPAAYFSAEYIRRYGLETLLSDKSMLEDFKARVFARFLETLRLSDEEWFILQYLAGEQGVPLGALSLASGIGQGSLVVILRKLIDFSLAIPVDDNFLVSGPIRTSVQRAKGLILKERYKEISEALTNAFWKDEFSSPSIEVVDATLHAVARSGVTDFEPYSDLVRPSTLHRLAKESYDRKEWKQALAYAERTLRIDPDRAEVQIIRLKSLVRIEDWIGAKRVLAEIEAKGDKKQFYLKGFMLSKQRRYEEALKAFQSALDSGDRSNSVFRDCAECLYRLGKFPEALDKISVALERDPGNIYTLDLIVRICIDGKNEMKAQQYLEQLERADKDERFIHHRKSRYYSLLRQWNSALEEAEKACDGGAALFEAFAQKVDVLIELNRVPDAKKVLEEIDRRFGRSRLDIQLGLECKLLLRSGKWREALTRWEGIKEKGSQVHVALYRQIMVQKSQDLVLPLSERSFAREQAEKAQSMIVPTVPMDDDALDL